MAEPEHHPTSSEIDPDLGPVSPVPVPSWLVLAGIAAGGAVGAVARHALELLRPAGAGAFPAATFVTNVVGCLLLGALVAFVTARRRHPVLRPVLGTGVLGGFTTFSTYAVQGRSLLGEEQVGLAVLYLGGTLVAAVAAALAGVLVVEALLARDASSGPGTGPEPGPGRGTAG